MRGVEVLGQAMLAVNRHIISKVLPEPLPSEGFRKMLGFWRSVQRAGDLPPVSAINPCIMPKEVLPKITIIGVEDGDKSLRIRMTGEAIKSASGSDNTHRFGEDIEGGEDILRAYRHCIEERTLLYCQGPASWSVNNYKTYRSLLMPFVTPDGRIRRVVTYLEIEIDPIAWPLNQERT